MIGPLVMARLNYRLWIQIYFTQIDRLPSLWSAQMTLKNILTFLKTVLMQGIRL